jgi:16S rRNA G966 N2-methylase RsmD
VDTRVVYCRDNLEQLAKLPAACVDLIYIDPPFNSNRNYEVFWGETKEKRAIVTSRIPVISSRTTLQTVVRVKATTTTTLAASRECRNTFATIRRC